MKSIFRRATDCKELLYPPQGIIIRAGVIPYTIKDGKRYYLLGLFRDNCYTDMGGGAKTSRFERPIDCINREVEEETDKRTAEVVLSTLLVPPKDIEIWCQTAPMFRDFGYSFRQRRPGPVHRYYVLLPISDPLLSLGGITGSEEVDRYEWIAEEELKTKRYSDFNPSLVDFLLMRGLISSD